LSLLLSSAVLNAVQPESIETADAMQQNILFNVSYAEAADIVFLGKDPGLLKHCREV
jgi:hypothetical protein